MLECLSAGGGQGAQSYFCCSPAGSASWFIFALLTSLLGSSLLPGQAKDTTNHCLVSFHPSRRRALVLLPPPPMASPTFVEEHSGSSAHSSQRCSPPRLSAGTWRGNNPWFHPSCSTTQSNITCSLGSATTTSPPLVLGGLFLILLLAGMGTSTLPPPCVPVALPESVA